MLKQEIIDSIEKSVLCWLATANEAGEPNVSPKEIFCYADDCFLIANIASPGSAKNVLLNKSVAVSFIDIFEQKGFQLKGLAQLINQSDLEFNKFSAPLKRMTEGKYPFTSLFKIKIESTKPIIAPSYLFYPEIKTSDKIAAAKQQYKIE